MLILIKNPNQDMEILLQNPNTDTHQNLFSHSDFYKQQPLNKIYQNPSIAVWSGSGEADSESVSG